MTPDDRLDYIMSPLLVRLNQKLDCLLDCQANLLEIMTTKPIVSDSTNNLSKLISDQDYQLESCLNEIKQQFLRYEHTQQEILSLLRERLK